MMKESVLVLLLVSYHKVSADLVIHGTELVMTFLIHRHGDRSPVETFINYSNDPEKLTELSKPYGYGQLTPAGKRRSYELGKFIRSRYNEHLSTKYNRSQIYIRSRDSTRAKMTILAAMAAVYPAGETSWSQEVNINWEPIPYTTVPAKYDFNLANVNCPVFRKAYLTVFYSPAPSMMKHYRVLNILAKRLGIDLIKQPALVYGIYDLFLSQLNVGLPLDPEIEVILPKIKVAAGDAIDLVFGNEKYVALQAGVLLNEFYEKAREAIAGQDTPSVRIYSAHDINVFSFLSVTQIRNKQGVPKYNSAYALELRRLPLTGKYVVVPVYLPSPGEDVMYLSVKGCGIVCDFDQFVNITSEYARDENTWRQECGFSNNMVVDDSAIA